MPMFSVVVSEEKHLVVEATDAGEVRELFEGRQLEGRSQVQEHHDRLISVEPC